MNGWQGIILNKMSTKMQRNSNNVLIRISRRAFAFILIAGIPILLFLSAFGVKKAEVIGAKRYTNNQIREMVLQSKLDHNTLYLYLKYRFFEKPKIPFVEKLDVEMVNNHTVTIYVYEKMIAGCVEFLGEYLYFDKDGIIVESSSKRIEGVPIIKGLNYNEIVLNEKLHIQNNVLQQETTGSTADQSNQQDSQNTDSKQPPDDEQQNEQKNKKEKKDEQNNEQKEKLQEVQNDDLFHVIINLTQLIGKYGLDVDTVSFGQNYEVTLECGKNTVLLGRRDTYVEVLAELKNILKEAKGMELMIDMSTFHKGDKVFAKPKNSTE
jgi:cell division protein FtsQ